ncbi:MAG: hypothetical protein ACR2L1_05080 [Pyrinomonadaceae bacterium]
MTLKKKYEYNKIFNLSGICFLFLIFSPTANYAQEISARITLIQVNADQARVVVQGRFLNVKKVPANKNLSFLRNYADAENFGARIGNLAAADEKGRTLEVKKLIDGEFQASEQPVNFNYTVKVAVPEVYTSAAHISWLSEDGGLLMLNDLLPQISDGQPVSAAISFKMPDGWNISSTETRLSDDIYSVKDIRKAIFLVGKNYREKTTKIGSTDLKLAISGDWQFSDDEALQMAAEILQEENKIFGAAAASGGKVQINLLPFPKKPVSADRWRAETRGATVSVLSGAIPLKSQALQRLHEQLRHEIFHLWIPNALVLSGNYDWFYEGFTIYLALRTGIEMNQIRFEDYLNTLSEAYNLSQNQSVSLIAMSDNRWMGANNSVYAKGMIVAFLCDAAILRESKGKRSIAEIFRAVYQKHRVPNEVQDGNTAILDILNSYPELQPIVKNYIEGAAKVEWRDELNNFGIETVDNKSLTQLKVMPKLSGRQKDLLDKLGYNQWRKLGQKTK